MRPLRPPYGISDFRLLRQKGYSYVDKTRFIRVLEERPEPYVLFLRPRRFGKSLWLSVLRHYYDVELRDRWGELFAGLTIAEAPTPERSSFRMLSFNFSGVLANAVANADEGMRLKVIDGVKTFLETYGMASEADIRRLWELPTAASVLQAGLQAARKREAPIFVLVDEYDHFTNELLARDPHEFATSVERGGFVRKFYEVLKEGTETVVSRILITGVTPVTLDSLTSGFNIAANLTLKPNLHEMMGFTHDEVESLLGQGSDIDVTARQKIRNELAQWYDGYCFVRGGQRLFNPDMVLYYLANCEGDGNPPVEMLDTNVASDYRTIERTVKLAAEPDHDLLDEVLLNDEVSVMLTRQFSLSRGLHRDDVASLLFYFGQLTISKPDLAGELMRVPNRVIAELFWDTVRVLRSDLAGFDASLFEIRRAVGSLARDGELAPLTGLVEAYLDALLSNRDLQNFVEKDLKIAFLMLVHAPRVYLVLSEAEAKRGYIDILLLPRPGIPDVWEHALELKYLKADATDAAVARAAEEAYEQLDRYLDAEGLRERPKLIPWVVVFRGTKCEALERSG